MRLNNKELKVVVDEIYKRVSQPIVDANEKIKDSIVVDDDYTRDFSIVTDLLSQSDKINEEIQRINKYWIDKKVHFGLSGYNREGSLRAYINMVKSSSAKLSKYPTKEEIESQIIIAGYSEIPELIAQIIAMYQ